MDKEKTETRVVKELVPVTDTSELSHYLDTHKFEQCARVAQMLSKAKLVPEAYRGSPADCLIALNAAARMRLDPLMFMQKTYILHGKLGMEAQLIIALINKSGLFTDNVQYKLSGEGDALQCEAFVYSVSTNAKFSVICSVKEAKDMGWWSKPGSPWPKQTHKMLRYRAATNLGRFACPEVLFGMDTIEELRDDESASEPEKPKDITSKTEELESTPIGKSLHLNKVKKRREAIKKRAQMKNDAPAIESHALKTILDSDLAQMQIVKEKAAELRAMAKNEKYKDGMLQAISDKQIPNGGTLITLCNEPKKNDLVKIEEYMAIIRSYTKVEELDDREPIVKELELMLNDIDYAKALDKLKISGHSSEYLFQVCENNDATLAKTIVTQLKTLNIGA